VNPTEGEQLFRAKPNTCSGASRTGIGAKPVRWDFLEKETVDEMVFKIPKVRDRLLVELMARGVFAGK